MFPSTGNQKTLFNFTASYIDQENLSPVNIFVNISGTEYPMFKQNISDNQYSDGVDYQFLTYLQPGIHYYNFTCFDGKFTNFTSSKSVIVTSSGNSNAPSLNNIQLNPREGVISITLFNLTLNYTDIDNNAPTHLNTTINSNIYSLSKNNLSDNNYMDGCWYEFFIIFNITGDWDFYLNSSDGLFDVYFDPSYNIKVKENVLINYSLDDSNPYNWINATGGTELSLSDNGYSTQSLPFSFKYYDINYTTIYVGANGYLSFYDSSPSYTGGTIPSSSSGYRYVIAPFWDDLQCASGGGAGNIYVESYGTYWVVEWKDIEHYNNNLVGSFEVILFNNGSIIFNYDYIDYVAGGYTCGLNYALDTSYYCRYTQLTTSTDNLSLLFTDSNMNGPSLSSGDVNPLSGNQSTYYNFSVSYTDIDNNQPQYLYLNINGSNYSMIKQNPVDYDYTDGCLFYYEKFLNTSLYNYTYLYQCHDGQFYYYIGPFNDLEVNYSNSFAPILSDAQATPSVGGADTTFNFSVMYQDLDNNFPIINITFDGGTYPMVIVEPMDFNVMDGCYYYFTVSASIYGILNYTIRCWDGGYNSNTGELQGPECNPFYNLTYYFLGINEINSFYDFVEIVNKGPDQDMTNWYLRLYNNDALFKTYTFPNGWIFKENYVVVVNEYSGSNTDTDLYLGSDISWTSSSDVAVGIFNDLGENIDWVQTYGHKGSVPADAQWVDDDYISMSRNDIYRKDMVDNDLNSDWEMSSSRSEGFWNPGQSFDDWYLYQLSPQNSRTFFQNGVEFQWKSLDISGCTPQYSLQISDSQDFSNIVFQKDGIVETASSTSFQYNTILEDGLYYWRICPTYSSFTGNWSKTLSFNLNLVEEPLAPLESSPENILIIIGIILAVIGGAVYLYVKGKIKSGQKIKFKKLRSKMSSTRSTQAERDRINRLTNTPSQQYKRPSPYQQVTPADRVEELRKFLNNLPPPKSRFTTEGVKALLVAEIAKRNIAGGNIQEAFNSVILALKMGVPEPENSILKNLLADSIPGAKRTQYSPIIRTIEKPSVPSNICPHCGHPDKDSNKFCSKCGENILESTPPQIPVPSKEILKDVYLGIACSDCSAPYLILKSKLDSFRCTKCSSESPKVIYRCDSCRNTFPISKEVAENSDFQSSFDCPQCGNLILLVKQDKDQQSSSEPQISLGPESDRKPTPIVKEKINFIPNSQTMAVKKVCPHCGAINNSSNIYCGKCLNRMMI